MKQFEILVFELGGEEFALPMSSVEEVLPATQITPVPHSPYFLLGLSAVRGRVMGVIDAGRRYGIAPTLNTHFLVCRVRGNLTAVTIDRPVLAGSLYLRQLETAEVEKARLKSGVGSKFIKGGYELLDFEKEENICKPTGRFFLEVHPDLFVSHEMASKVGEI